MGPWSLVSPRNDAADELARPGALLVPSAIPFSLSFLNTLVFSPTESVLSHRNFSTHRFPWLPLRNLCSLFTLAVCSLVYAATNRVDC